MTGDAAPMIDISPVSATEYATRIRSRLADSVENFIDIGRTLIEAKQKLSHGEFTHMVEADLPFGPRTAQRFMKIAAHPVLSDATRGSLLPASWRTLYELSRLDDEELQEGFSKRLIGPGLGRKDLPGLLARIHRALGRRVSRKPPRKAFFADFRRHFSRESIAWLDQIEADYRHRLIEELERVIREAMRDG